MGFIVAALAVGYLMAGAMIALLFALRWAPLLASPPAAVSMGARILLAPGAALLWPLVLQRRLATRPA